MDKRRQLAMTLGLLVLGLGVVVLVLTLTNREEPVDSAEQAAEAPAGGDRDYETFVNETEGFSIAVPEDWVQATARSADPNVQFVAARPGTDDAVTVSTVTFDHPVTVNARTPPELVSALQDQLDQFVDRIPDTELVQRTRIAVGDVQGWTYIYRFTDETDRVGVQVRHILFRGRKMYQIVFQAFPLEHYGEMAAVFDEILGNFEFLDQADPEPASSPVEIDEPTP